MRGSRIVLVFILLVGWVRFRRNGGGSGGGVGVEDTARGAMEMLEKMRNDVQYISI